MQNFIIQILQKYSDNLINKTGEDVLNYIKTTLTKFYQGLKSLNDNLKHLSGFSIHIFGVLMCDFEYFSQIVAKLDIKQCMHKIRIYKDSQSVDYIVQLISLFKNIASSYQLDDTINGLPASVYEAIFKSEINHSKQSEKLFKNNSFEQYLEKVNQILKKDKHLLQMLNIEESFLQQRSKCLVRMYVMKFHEIFCEKFEEYLLTNSVENYKKIYRFYKIYDNFFDFNLSEPFSEALLKIANDAIQELVECKSN